MKTKTNAPAAPQSTGLSANLTPEQAAEILGVSPYTLSNWRVGKRQPLPYVKLGRLVRYRRADIEAFLSSNLVSDL
ncbi:helix-turn-helix domain-containing protein [Paraburkholderia sediminicola]|uniref:helix-turn-helix domain-containing protein n=1 Tax=Paraburkholderia sediminicola TaxID=458836 RepID=UPI0038B92DAB